VGRGKVAQPHVLDEQIGAAKGDVGMAGKLGHGARAGAGAEAGGEEVAEVEEGAEVPGRKVWGNEAWPVLSGGRNSGPRCPHPDNTPRAASAVT